MLQILGKIGFDWQLALANLVNFLVVFWVLKKFVFKPVSETINKRQQAIDKSLAGAEEARHEMESVRERSEVILRQAREKAAVLLNDATQKANALESSMREQFEMEKATTLKEAERDIARKEEEARARVADHATELAMLGAERIIGESLPQEYKAKFSSNMLAK